MRILFALGVVLVAVAVTTILVFTVPLARIFGFAFPPLGRWAKAKRSPEYIIEVHVPAAGGDEEYWLPLGRPRPTLQQAKAALEACRRIKSCANRAMRIRCDEYPLIEVAPGDPPLVELH